MKLFLVNANFSNYVGVPSLGLGFIGTYIRCHSSCEVEIVEPALQTMSSDDVLRRICATKGQLYVGLGCYTESRFDCFEFGRKVKQSRPDAVLIIGGVHVNTLDVLALQNYPFVDIIARGESEDIVLDIVNRRPLRDIKGITWRKNGNIVRNPDRTLRLHIDDLGYDYSLVEPWIVQWKDLEIPVQYQKCVHLPIIMSRGCKFRCSFCGAFNFWRHTYRVVSCDEIVRRMQYLVAKYDVGYFRFYDALFLGNENERIMEFCALLKKHDLKVKFRIDLRVGTNPAILEALRDAGCIVIGFGVESGSDRVLKQLSKGITQRQIVETSKLCRQLGIWSIGFFMISMPTETINDARETFSVFRLFDEMNLQFFKIHPGTPIYDELKSRGEISDEVWFDNERHEAEYLYCKENFPSALLRRKTVDLMIFKYYIQLSKLKHLFGVARIHPGKILGKIFGVMRVPFVGIIHKSR